MDYLMFFRCLACLAYYIGNGLTYFYFWERDKEDSILVHIFCFLWPIGWICNGIWCVWRKFASSIKSVAKKETIGNYDDMDDMVEIKNMEDKVRNIWKADKVKGNNGIKIEVVKIKRGRIRKIR